MTYHEMESTIHTKREVTMRNLLWKALTLTALAVGMTCICEAQTTGSQPGETARADPPAAPEPSRDTHASPSAAQPDLQQTVTQEIKALKARIDQLENEVKAEKTRALADSEDTAALKAAEKEVVAGNGSAALNPATGVSASFHGATGPVAPGESSSLQAATPPAEAATTTPEISAQTTTKGEPFPGDWTWLNSNGHQTDSPMATKYFTPEFRADANYILDYNHPKDDTMGGATESFRSDEWQLEQISIGGDIHINNVRGRILTMDGLFATTTPRNDGSPNRG